MKKIKKTLDIGEVAKAVGLAPSALRYYEEKGLIQSIGRSGLRRYFDELVIEKLKFIAMGRQANFTLEEISAMFTTNGRLQVNRKALLEKSDRIERDIKQLEAIRNTLQHVAHCSAPNHLACPKFRRLVELAGKKQLKPMKKPSSIAR